PPRSPCSTILSLHDALPISGIQELCQRLLAQNERRRGEEILESLAGFERTSCSDNRRMLRIEYQRRRVQFRNGHSSVIHLHRFRDRKSTRVNSSHVKISYAV